jgi:hypothetical protein
MFRDKSFHQRGEFIMSEKQKKINVEMVDGMSNITAQASIYWVDRFFRNSGLSNAIDEFIGARRLRGAKDSDHIKTEEGFVATSRRRGGGVVPQRQRGIPDKAHEILRVW